MKVLTAVISFILFSIMYSTNASAVSSSLVISQLQTGDTQSASNEAVELYNNSSNDQNITDWCVRYAAATSSTLSNSPKYCFTAPDTLTKVYLKARSYAYVATATFGTTSPAPDGRFVSSGFANTGGHIKLLDASGVVMDTLGWGTAWFPESAAAAAPSTSQTLLRKPTTTPALTPTLQDTDNNLADFVVAAPLFHTGGIYEVRTVVDLCANVAGIQEVLPVGYGYDDAGNCELVSSDKCKNIAAIQIEYPSGMLADETGNCFIDTCPNLDALQVILPAGYEVIGGMCQKLEDRRLEISEVFANADGSDTGLEYIEIRNPWLEPVPLRGYKLLVGKNFEKSYQIVSDTSSDVIAPGGYLVFRDGDLGFTLLNSTSGVRIVAPSGQTVSETSYSNPKDDVSWSWFDDGWAYTTIATPGKQNQRPEVLAEETITQVTVTSTIPCAAGKYRHPITNRCRNIESDTTMLVACDNDEYRNPETNRCRKIATLTTSLTPCSDGYERNAETNRCRKMTAISTSLTPCKQGYERSAETNRCRKVTAEPQRVVASAVNAQSPGSTATNVLLMTAGIGALSYGLYEWRSELRGGMRRLLQLVTGK